MPRIKYVKAPTSNSPRYLDGELRKIETSIDTILSLQEELEMSLTEYGTFTPVIAGATTPGVGTYTTQEGQYYKIGRFVLVFFRVITTAHTGTGQINITGLPYKAKSSPSNNSYFSSRMYGGNTGAELILMQANSQVLSAWNGATPPGVVNIVAAMDITGCLSYFTD